MKQTKTILVALFSVALAAGCAKEKQAEETPATQAATQGAAKTEAPKTEAPKTAMADNNPDAAAQLLVLKFHHDS